MPDRLAGHAAGLARRALAQQAGSLVQGELLRFDAVRLSQSPWGRQRTGIAPVVAFRAADASAQTLHRIAVLAAAGLAVLMPVLTRLITAWPGAAAHRLRPPGRLRRTTRPLPRRRAAR